MAHMRGIAGAGGVQPTLGGVVFALHRFSDGSAGGKHALLGDGQRLTGLLGEGHACGAQRQQHGKNDAWDFAMHAQTSCNQFFGFIGAGMPRFVKGRTQPVQFFRRYAVHGSGIGRCTLRAPWVTAFAAKLPQKNAGGLRSGPMKGAEGTGFRGVALGETAICVAMPGACLKILKRQFRHLLRRYGAAHFLRKPAENLPVIADFSYSQCTLGRRPLSLPTRASTPAFAPGGTLQAFSSQKAMAWSIQPSATVPVPRPKPCGRPG